MVETIVNEFWLQAMVYAPKLLIAAGLLILSYYLARMLRAAMKRAYALRPIAPGAANLTIETAYWGVILIGIFLGLQQFFDVATFLAGLGLVGFAVGFALQDVIKNLAAGILLIMQGPFSVGEAIGVGVHEGTVEAITLRSIAIRTWDGRLVHIPNADLLNSPMVNFTRSPNRRAQVGVGVAYGSDLEKAKEIALRAISGLPGLQAQPAPQVVFTQLTPFAVEFMFYFWVDVNTSPLFDAQDFALRAIQKAFAQEGIEIPFPISGPANLPKP